MDKAVLESLLERVETATGANYSLEVTLVDALVPELSARAIYPNCTASIDAALALVERVLPGWVWNVGGCQPDFLTDKDKPMGAEIMGPVTWKVIDRDVGEEPTFDSYSASATTAPFAILAALLKALIARAE